MTDIQVFLLCMLAPIISLVIYSIYALTHLDWFASHIQKCSEDNLFFMCDAFAIFVVGLVLLIKKYIFFWR